MVGHPEDVLEPRPHLLVPADRIGSPLASDQRVPQHHRDVEAAQGEHRNDQQRCAWPSGGQRETRATQREAQQGDRADPGPEHEAADGRPGIDQPARQPDRQRGGRVEIVVVARALRAEEEGVARRRSAGDDGLRRGGVFDRVVGGERLEQQRAGVEVDPFEKHESEPARGQQEGDRRRALHAGPPQAERAAARQHQVERDRGVEADEARRQADEAGQQGEAVECTLAEARPRLGR